MTHVCTYGSGPDSVLQTPAETATHSITELQRRLKSPIQFKLFARTDWLCNILGFSKTDRALLHWLVYFGLKKEVKDVTFVTQKRLSQLTGLSTKTVARFITKMDKLGLLKKFPQAIRFKEGAAVFGPMQNQFTPQAHKLLTADQLQNIELPTEKPRHLSEIRLKTSSEDPGKMPEHQQELQWLCDRLGNKHLVFKLMKIAAPHIRANNCKGLDDLLQTYKTPLLDGTIANPAAYLLTRLMASKFGPYQAEQLSDQELERRKLITKRQEEAQQARFSILNFAKTRVEELNQMQGPIHFIGLQCGKKVIYEKGRAWITDNKGRLEECDYDEFLLKLGTGRLARIGQSNSRHPVRQKRLTMSDLQLDLSKFIETKEREAVTCQQWDISNSTEKRPEDFLKNPNPHIPSSSVEAIAKMRSLLKSSRT